jgi:hypothetical protein
MTTKDAARHALLGCLILLLVAPPGALAQVPPPPPPPSAGAPAPPTVGAEELDQLLAPIALYPDALLAQILMAATYPLEVVQAARWVQAYPNVQGPQLEAAMQQQPWDPSVKSLTAFPQVLAMMNAKLDWTQKVGDAFLAQQQDVMATVQTLRAKAQAAGYLQSTPQQAVISEPQGIQIQPATPQVVYVPIYDPTVVYGPWWYPAYPPYYWYPPGYVVGASLFSFGIGVAVGAVLWGGFDWGHRSVHINVTNFNAFNRTTIADPTWHHDAGHRRGVAYHDAGVRQRFGQAPRPGVDARETFRGRAQAAPQQLAPRGAERRPGGGSAARVGGGPPGGLAGPQAPQAPRQPAALEGLGRGGETRNFSDRGRTSRQSMPAARPAPSAPVSRPSTGAAKPAPSAPRTTGGGGRTGGGSGERK